MATPAEPSIFDKAAAKKEEAMKAEGYTFERGDHEENDREHHLIMRSSVTPELDANGEAQVRVPEWLSNSGMFDTADMDFCNNQHNHFVKLAAERRQKENRQVEQFQAQAAAARDAAALAEETRLKALLGAAPAKTAKRDVPLASAPKFIKRKKLDGRPANGAANGAAPAQDRAATTPAPAKPPAPAPAAAASGGLLGTSYDSDEDSD
ncbi:hypothetical protein M885DRAFT_617655 [Pelagophyceae sp. CCMP2097]|nr:hypothetical protein M885DRAFT_617655 [Pelagophyceae sp. CCMP2097]|mmetsp:Transcript_1730/g.6350  ORF Transcript_1730/g.6350 Transcript_1730/m.6350 type:complete len:208 (-) Transcript_1730:8-631(-)